MYSKVTGYAAAIVIAVGAAACSMPMTELLRDVVPGNGNPTVAPLKGIQTCTPTGATPTRLAAHTMLGRKNAFSIENALNLSKVTQRLQNLPGILHPELRNEPVVQEILRAAGATIYQTQMHSINLAKQIDVLYPRRRLTASALLSQFDASNDANAAALNSQPRNLNHTDFMSLGTALRHALVESAAPSDASSDAKQFAQAFVYYFKAFIGGKFYTRFGQSVAGQSAVVSFNGSPAVISVSGTTASVTVTDAEIAGTVQVFLELVMDYALQTPVWSDGAKTPTYYPGKGTGNSTPTAVLANQAGFMPLTIDNLATNSMSCGIDPLKAQAVQYIATMVGNNASELAGVVGGSFGGINLGLGVLGKVSIGDNKTIHDAVTTALQTALTRAGEEASWRTLYWIGYPSTSNIDKDVIALIQQYLNAQLGTAGT